MPGLSIETDQQGDLDIRQVRQQGVSPCFSTDLHGRTVTPLLAITWKTEAHRDNGDPFRIIEIRFRDLHPVAQALAGRIIEGCARLIGKVSGRLPRNQDARFGIRLQDRVRLAIHPGFAQAASANLFEQAFQFVRHGVS